MTNAQRVADGTLAWIRSHLNQFAVPRQGAPQVRVPLVKPLAELALAGDFLVSHAAAGSVLATAGRELLEFSWRELDEGALLRRIVLEHPYLPMFATVYTSFLPHGLRLAELERVILDLASVRGIVALELPGWCQLALAKVFESLAAPPPPAWTTERALQRTWMAAHPEPWSLCELSAYGLSHAVYYATESGRRPDGLPAEDRRYLQRWLPVWIHRFANSGNADLLAELVMVDRCFGGAAEEDWCALLATFQEPDGMIPSPQVGMVDSGLIEQFQPEIADPRRRRFLDNYHTTLVSLVAATMCLATTPSEPRAPRPH